MNSIGFAFICKWGAWSKLALQNRWSSLGDFPWFLFIYLFAPILPPYNYLLCFQSPRFPNSYVVRLVKPTCSPSIPHSKTISSLSLPPSKFLFSHCISSEWLIGMPLPFALYNSETFLKSARFARRVGKEGGMFIAFNPFFAGN